MIKYTKGDLLKANTDALVNTVNTVGVMGKGIALQFKKAYPHNFKVYKQACKDKTFGIGNILTVQDNNLNGSVFILNFPTKKHWRGKSTYEFIEQGLDILPSILKKNGIKSVAIPPLGCGNGGLDWQKVKALIEKYLGSLEEEIVIYEPNENIETLLKGDTKKQTTQLTPAKAMLLYALFYYEMLGEDSNLFVANKLAYFFKRLGVSDFQRLDFKAYYYGPYSEQVIHVLHNMNASYLRGLEQMNVKPFERIELFYDKKEIVSQYIHKEISNEKIQQLKNLIHLINGFETPFSLEILSSVDYVLKNKPQASLEEVMASISSWNNRKSKLFKPQQIKIAYEHLKSYQTRLNF